jgi:uncharacterized protein YndB with AHSA1/START domain
MAASNQIANSAPGIRPPTMVITEILHAPRTLVFKTWTDARHVAQWWGPHEFTNPVCEWDARPGGLIRIDMQAPDGTVYPMRGVFHDVREPEWLDFTTTAFADEQGSDQLQVRHNVTFEERGGKTKLTLQSRVVKTTPATAQPLASMEEGWKQSFARLADLLATM